MTPLNESEGFKRLFENTSPRNKSQLFAGSTEILSDLFAVVAEEEYFKSGEAGKLP